MTQALYAFLAIMIVTTFALSQRGAIVQSQLSAVKNDLDLMGSGLATEHLDYIETRPFDSNLPVSSTADLTPLANFGSITDYYDPTNDVDDFDNKVLLLKIPAFQDSVSFELEVQVGYVQKVGSTYVPDSTNQTNSKEVSVTVKAEGLSTVHISRILFND